MANVHGSLRISLQFFQQLYAKKRHHNFSSFFSKESCHQMQGNKAFRFVKRK